MEALIFGADGQLGHALGERLPQARAIGHAKCDVTIPQDVHKAMTNCAPTTVFNATAYNEVDAAESDRDRAFEVNAVGAGRLAAAARRVSADFVHYSTDYVFGDGFAEPIDESKTPEPLSMYGTSKRHGERLVVQNNPQSYIVRTAALYGHRRSNFVTRSIRKAVRGERITAVSDEFFSPTWAESLADVSVKLSGCQVHGTYHVTSRGSCSWYELAGRIFEILDLDADLHPIGREERRAAARRPRYSVLDNAMLRAVRIDSIGRWDDELEAFLDKHGERLLARATDD